MRDRGKGGLEIVLSNEFFRDIIKKIFICVPVLFNFL